MKHETIENQPCITTLLERWRITELKDSSSIGWWIADLYRFGVIAIIQLTQKKQQQQQNQNGLLLRQSIGDANEQIKQNDHTKTKAKYLL